jgi:hypothetical protein
MSEPDLGLVRRTRAPRRQQRTELGNELRLHEEIGEGGVRLVCGLGSQHDLGIRRQVDLTVVALEIGDGQPAQLGIVFG